MDNQYSKLMTDFFKSIDKSVEKEPDLLARQYFEYFIDKEVNRFLQKPKDENTVVASLTNDASLSFYTKRIFLLGDTTLLTHKNEEILNYVPKVGGNEHYLPDGRYHRKIKDSLIKTAYGMTDVDVAHNYYGICNGFTELGMWLKDCKDLLTRGDLFYYPNILTEGFYEDDGADDWTYRSDSFHNETGYEIVRKYNRFADIMTNDIKIGNLIRPIVQVNIPNIDDINLKDFCKITAEEVEPFNNFKSALRIAFQDLKANEGSETFDNNLLKIGRNIKKDLESLEKDFKKLNNKRIFNTIKASIATVSAVLVAVHSTALDDVIKLVGTSSGVGIIYIISQLQEYRDSKLDISKSENYYNYYYLWLIGRKV